MNKRERLMIGLIGGGIGLAVLYNVVSFFFLTPYRTAQDDIAKYRVEKAKLDGILGMKMRLLRDWRDGVGRTFSYDPAEAKDLFGHMLKEIALRHGFGNAVFATSGGSRIGASRNKMNNVAHRVTVEGEFAKIIDLLRDVYDSPFLSQVTTIVLTEPRKGGSRNSVKLEMTVETPVLPPLDAKEFPDFASTIKPMPKAPEEPLDSFRADLAPDEEYLVLEERNILRPYLAPPEHVILIENQDWKTVAARIRFYWEGRAGAEQIETIASKGTKSVKGKGDVVEVEGTYADGAPFGPQRFDFSARANWTYAVAAHHPPPEPDEIQLAVKNENASAIYVNVVVIGKDNRQQRKPTMRIDPGTTDIDEFKDAVSVKVSGIYESGKNAAPETFTPAKAKQTYVVPVEPEEAVDVVVDQSGGDDPPAEAGVRVTGLLTYKGVHEMLCVGAANERRIIKAGIPGEVDNGTLLAVHPLGGVVKMDETGHFYLYPLGRTFEERVRLEAESEEDLATAIDEWTRGPAHPSETDGYTDRTR